MDLDLSQARVGLGMPQVGSTKTSADRGAWITHIRDCCYMCLSRACMMGMPATNHWFLRFLLFQTPKLSVFKLYELVRTSRIFLEWKMYLFELNQDELLDKTFLHLNLCYALKHGSKTTIGFHWSIYATIRLMVTCKCPSTHIS